jgi:cardiolipin synthase
MMNLPNTLTIMRFFLIPLFVYIYFANFEHSMLLAFLTLMMAGLTDILDGYLARTRKQITPIGIMLDPLADKLLMLAVVVTFLVSGRITWLAAGTLLFRDLGMIIGSAVFHLRGKKTVPANILGKINTALYYVVIFFLMFNLPSADVILWGVIAFSFVTSFIYITQIKSLNQRTLDLT